PQCAVWSKTAAAARYCRRRLRATRSRPAKSSRWLGRRSGICLSQCDGGNSAYHRRRFAPSSKWLARALRPKRLGPAPPPLLFLIRQAVDCDDPKLRATLANLRCRLVLGRIVPAVNRLQVGKLQDSHAARGRPIALEQGIVLTPGEISSAIFGQYLASQ